MTLLYRAIVFMCLGKLVFSIQDAIMKGMSATYPMHEIMFIRSVVSLTLLFVAIKLSGDSIRLDGAPIRLLLFRGSLLFASFCLFYLGLSEIPLTTNTVLFFTAPLFITLFCVPLLGETVGPRRIMGVIAGFVGVWIVLRPGSNLYGLKSIYPILSAVLYSLAQLLSRKMGSVASATVMTFFANITYFVLALLVAIVVMPFGVSELSSKSMQFLLRPWSMPLSSLDGLLLFITGVTGAVGFWLTTQAYRISEANKIAPFEYVMLIWVPILSYLIWQDIPDTMTVLGASIIVISGLYVLRRDRIQSEKALS